MGFINNAYDAVDNAMNVHEKKTKRAKAKMLAKRRMDEKKQ